MVASGVLRIYRRHEAWCAKTSKADPTCKPKAKTQSRGHCPVWITGTLQDGTDVKPRSLNTRNWQLAAQKLLEMEAGMKPTPAATTLKDAAALFLLSKGKRSASHQRKLKRLTEQLIALADREGKRCVAEVDLALLIRFVAGWASANTTQRASRENLRSFFRFCVKAKFIGESPAEDLEAITATTAQTDVFTHDELRAIMGALPNLEDEYGRAGQPVALQTRAFVLVMRYTGLSIGDVTGLKKTSVNGNQIVTNRDKTEKEVYVRVPPFVIDALNQAPHDSAEYFFWSGGGLIHTRSTKWGARLQRLFIAAGVRLTDAPWPSKASRRQREGSAKRIVSEADPRWFRHTLARDLLVEGIVTMTELAEILGNSEAVCRKHYSKWDKRRQDKIDSKLEAFWQTDPVFETLSMAETKRNTIR